MNFGGDAASMLLDLLAVIHRDGGHRVDEVGLAQATEEAMLISSRRIQYQDFFMQYVGLGEE